MRVLILATIAFNLLVTVICKGQVPETDSLLSLKTMEGMLNKEQLSKVEEMLTLGEYSKQSTYGEGKSNYIHVGSKREIKFIAISDTLRTVEFRTPNKEDYQRIVGEIDNKYTAIASTRLDNIFVSTFKADPFFLYLIVISNPKSSKSYLISLTNHNQGNQRVFQ